MNSQDDSVFHKEVLTKKHLWTTKTGVLWLHDLICTWKADIEKSERRRDRSSLDVGKTYLLPLQVVQTHKDSLDKYKT